MRYIGSLSVSHDAPHETQANTLCVCSDEREAAKTIDKASGAHDGQYLSFHAERPPSMLNQAQYAAASLPGFRCLQTEHGYTDTREPPGWTTNRPLLGVAREKSWPPQPSSGRFAPRPAVWVRGTPIQAPRQGQLGMGQKENLQGVLNSSRLLAAPRAVMPAYFDADISGSGQSALVSNNVIYLVCRLTTLDRSVRILDPIPPADHILRAGWLSLGDVLNVIGGVNVDYWREPIFLDFETTLWTPIASGGGGGPFTLQATLVRWSLAGSTSGHLYIFGS